MQWQTDLIGYNTLSAYGSPGYWAQQMFSTHVGDAVLSMTAANILTKEWQPPVRRRPGPPGAPAPAGEVLTPLTPMPVTLPLMFFSATRDSVSGTMYVKLVNHTAAAQTVHFAISGLSSIAPAGKTITLSASSIEDTNSITEPNKLVPVTAAVTGLGAEFTRTVPAYSITILELTGK